MGQNEMKSRRLRLDDLLRTFCKNVYFQPPASIHMSYPCIRYKRVDIEHVYANNKPYLSDYAYELIVIDRDPDSDIVYKVSQLPLSDHTGSYVADNLYHNRFIIYA